MLRWFEHSQVYHPDRVLSASPSELGRPFEEVFFDTTDRIHLHGWFFPANKGSARERFVVLLCHGNAGNISHRLGMCDALLESGAAVLNFDYRGYGRSQGRPSEEGTYRDAQAAHAWLRTKGFLPEHIIAFGESLGGGIASELALREKLGGLILENTFSCLPDIGAELFPWLPVRWISTIKYDTCSKLPRVKVPVLIMHSPADQLIPFRHGKKNFAVANEPKLFWELKGGHNEPVSDRANFIAGIDKFFRVIESTSDRGL